MQKFTYSLYILLLLVFIPGIAANAQAPVANFTANTLQGCAPLIVQFTSTSTNNPTSYSWNLGNSVTSTLQNPSTTYSNPGTYTVTLTATNGSGSNTKTVTAYITVFPSPTINFSGTPLAICPGGVVQFTNLSTNNAPGTPTYLWSFGDGNSSALEHPSHQYTVPGFYNVVLQITNGAGCTKNKLEPNYVQVYEPPTIDFTANTTVFCHPPGITTFTPSITGFPAYTYNWLFGDASPNSSAPSPTHTYALGNYSPTLIVTDGHGCKDTLTKPNYIHVQNPAPNFTLPPNGACVNDTAFFINTSAPAPILSTWYFGDGNSTTAVDANHVYTTPGTYTVKLVVNNNGCLDSIEHTIVVHPSPGSSFFTSPSQPCPAPSAITFTNTTPGTNTYTWYFGDNSTSTAINPIHTYNGDSFYTVKLVTVSSFGCRDSLTYIDTVKIFGLINAIHMDTSMGCVPLTVHFSATALTNTTPPLYASIIPYPYAVTSYLWNFGDFTPTSNSPTPVHTFTAQGIYYVKLTITTANGCTKTDSVIVRVGIPPVASFTAAPTTVCMRDSVVFTNTSTGATNYFWQFGDGGTTTATSPTYYYGVPGIFNVTLWAYNNGCPDSVKIDSLITGLAPKAIIDFEYDCDTPLLVRFFDSSKEATSHIWLFGDGFTSTASNPIHTYASMTTYSVKLATHSTVTGCRDTAFVNLQLLDPHPGFASSDTAICKNDYVVFTAFNNPFISQYFWVVNNTFVDTTNLPFFDTAYPTIGYYKIKMTYVDYHGCIDSVVKDHYQLVSWPAVNFGAAPVIGCTPLNVQFQDSTVSLPGVFPATRNWYFGNATNFGNVGNPQNIYPNIGLYTVKLVFIDNVGCKDSFTRADYIEARHPEADFVADDTASCIGQQISFINNSVGIGSLSYEWDFGDNTPTSGATYPTHAYMQTGIYEVRLIVTDNIGCKDTMLRTSYIHISKPVAAFDMSDTFAICPPLLVQFTNNSTGASTYNWNFGNGTSTVPSPSNPYTTPGQYIIRLVAIDGQGCTDTAFGSAKVLGYAGGLTYTPISGCYPLTVNFTANITNVPSLIWDFSDGVTQNANGVSTTSHTYMNMGAYVPKLIISDGNGCLTSSSGLDTIKVDGVIAGFKFGPPCEKTYVQFTDTSYSPFSPIITQIWYFGASAPVGGGVVSNYYNAPGTYPITLIATNAHGCKDTLEKTITIVPLPVIDAGQDTSICKGDYAVLQPSGGISYNWIQNGFLSCTGCTNPQANPTATTWFTVEGTDAVGCKNIDSVKVAIQTKTTFVSIDDGEVCEGLAFALKASGAQMYSWSPTATLVGSNTATPLAYPSTTTVYMVIGSEGTCIPDTQYVKVVVHPKPIVNAGDDQNIIAGGTAYLTATGTGISKYGWVDDGTLSCINCPNPIVSPKRTTQYWVAGISSFGCVDSDMVTIHVLCDKSQIYMPNTFTPNNDGHNDVFYPRGVGLDQIKVFRIYSRWGEVVYEKSGITLNDKTIGWDGTYKGVILRPDVYVYFLEGVCDTGEPLNIKGDITLIR